MLACFAGALPRVRGKINDVLMFALRVFSIKARDKKLQATNAEKLKRKVSRSLKDLKADIEEYRKIVNDVICGDKRLLRTILQKQKDLRILLQDAEPSVKCLDDPNRKHRILIMVTRN